MRPRGIGIYVDIEIKGGSIPAECKGHTAPGHLASQGPAKACVVDKIEEFRAELANPQIAQAERILALKYLLHFVGDIHQPLHAADSHDTGGNAIKVIRPGGGTMELHKYWDSALVGRGNDTIEETAARLVKNHKAKFQLWANGGPIDWAKESHVLAVNRAYALPVGKNRDKNDPPIQLSPNYEKDARDVVDEQLSKAGVRLAMILAQALP